MALLIICNSVIELTVSSFIPKLLIQWCLFPEHTYFLLYFLIVSLLTEEEAAFSPSSLMVEHAGSTPLIPKVATGSNSSQFNSFPLSQLISQRTLSVFTSHLHLSLPNGWLVRGLPPILKLCTILVSSSAPSAHCSFLDFTMSAMLFDTFTGMQYHKLFNYFVFLVIQILLLPLYSQALVIYVNFLKFSYFVSHPYKIIQPWIKEFNSTWMPSEKLLQWRSYGVLTPVDLCLVVARATFWLQVTMKLNSRTFSLHAADLTLHLLAVYCNMA